MNVPEVGPVASNTSVLVIVTLTGAPAFRASAAAIGSAYIVSFAPNPPPISIGTALTCETGTPINRAV